MEEKYLFEGESLITQSGDKTISLTSHRIRYNANSTGNAYIVSIMLEKISSIEIRYTSWIIVLVIGVILLAGGILLGSQNNGDAMVVGIVAGLVCILLYFITRKHIVSIASDGGAKINFQTKGLKREAILEFINKIEVAKAKKLK